MNETTIILEELKKIQDLISEINEKLENNLLALTLLNRRLIAKLEYLIDRKEPGSLSTAPDDEYLDQLEIEEHTKLYPSNITRQIK